MKAISMLKLMLKHIKTDDFDEETKAATVLLLLPFEPGENRLRITWRMWMKSLRRCQRSPGLRAGGIDAGWSSGQRGSIRTVIIANNLWLFVPVMVVFCFHLIMTVSLQKTKKLCRNKPDPARLPCGGRLLLSGCRMLGRRLGHVRDQHR